MDDTRYVVTLPHDEQWRIYVALLESGVAGEDIARAMNGRVCDLAEVVWCAT